ncbi:helix-turn-helix transcriptional regulator [Intrasporangium sp. YIM S08009]|uniref:helix-turn-helix transcriptional regulator n=1 Tax=Intrasporangium zincisolvens TaxID=3080018 RepID=UPI002B05447B|nr:helix-turn-helix transcriptional regulator [Intrasporangium sp. YIM S08009]
MDSVVFDSTDLDRIETFLSDAYAPMRIGSTAPSPHAHVDRVEGPDDLTVDHIDLGFEMLYDVSALGKICLCSIESGSVEDHRVAGSRHATSFGPGEVFSFSPPDRAYRGRINEARYSITMFDPGLLTEVAGGQSDNPIPVRLLDHRPVTRRRGEALRTAIDDAARALSAPGVTPLARDAAARDLAATVLRTFPTTADQGPTSADRDDAMASASLSRALDLVEAHTDEPLTLPELAAAAGVTPRALQQAFRRYLETTPSEYVRRVRLDRAHDDLAAGERDDGTTVTDVAMRWGFYHQGRFASAYRRRYGEAPHETLRGEQSARR